MSVRSTGMLVMVGGWVGSCGWSRDAESLHRKSRQVIGNAVVHASNMCDAYMVVTPGSHEKQVAYQGHKVGAFT